ncbi:MAG: hypothetical protein RR661_02370, partial [Anaerovoracaceae bacterium]
YAVTKKEILDTIKNSDRYSLENLVCLRVENHSFMLEGKEQLKEVTPGAYFGFLLDKGNLLSIVNMNTATQYEFTKGK